MSPTTGSIIGTRALLDNESGAVLVMVLIMLVATAIIGMVAMRTTLIETKIAGNERTYQQSFYVADSSNECTIERFDAIVSGLSLQKDIPEDISDAVNEVNPLNDASTTITYTRQGTPPVSSGTSAANTYANFYTIRSTINGETVTHGVWKAFPKAE